jgi:hypothetical protein
MNGKDGTWRGYFAWKMNRGRFSKWQNKSSEVAKLLVRAYKVLPALAQQPPYHNRLSSVLKANKHGAVAATNTLAVPSHGVAALFL